MKGTWRIGDEPIPAKYIIEVGFARKKDVCARCYSKMDIPKDNIQLCRKCREEELEKYAKEINDGEKKT